MCIFIIHYSFLYFAQVRDKRPVWRCFVLFPLTLHPNLTDCIVYIAHYIQITVDVPVSFSPYSYETNCNAFAEHLCKRKIRNRVLQLFACFALTTRLAHKPERDASTEPFERRKTVPSHSIAYSIWNGDHSAHVNAFSARWLVNSCQYVLRATPLYSLSARTFYERKEMVWLLAITVAPERDQSNVSCTPRDTILTIANRIYYNTHLISTYRHTNTYTHTDSQPYTDKHTILGLKNTSASHSAYLIHSIRFFSEFSHWRKHKTLERCARVCVRYYVHPFVHAHIHVRVSALVFVHFQWALRAYTFFHFQIKSDFPYASPLFNLWQQINETQRHRVRFQFLEFGVVIDRIRLLSIFLFLFQLLLMVWQSARSGHTRYVSACEWCVQATKINKMSLKKMPRTRNKWMVLRSAPLCRGAVCLCNVYVSIFCLSETCRSSAHRECTHFRAKMKRNTDNNPRTNVFHESMQTTTILLLFSWNTAKRWNHVNSSCVSIFSPKRKLAASFDK